MYFTQSNNGISSGSSYRIGRIRHVGNQPPVASFTMSPTPATGPIPLSVQFTDTSTDSDGTITAWSWDFGDGNNSTQQNPQHTYTVAGNYTVTLTVTDDDTAQDGEQAPVNATTPVAPVASFTTNPSPAVGKVPLQVQFTDTSTDSDGTIIAWSWDFGDGNISTLQNPTHTYMSDGMFTVTLTVTDNSALQDNDTAPVTVTLTVPPVASFTMNPSPATGLAPLNVQFTDTSTDSDGTIVAWSWNFGDGNTSTQQNPSHTYTSGGNFTVTLTVTDSDALQDSDQAPVTVTTPVPPVASFASIPAPPTGNAPFFAQFNDTSTDADGNIVTWAWDFGDGNTGNTQNASHIYNTAGMFVVTLTVTDNDGLQDSEQMTVTVNPAPEDAGGEDDEEDSGCSVQAATVWPWLGLVLLATLLIGIARVTRKVAFASSE
jgi:PKD repeat protein